MRRDHLRNEADYLPKSVEDLARLRRQLLDAGHSNALTGGVISWLVSKTAGEPDQTDSNTRSRYRKILAELQPVDPGPGSNRHLEVVPAAAGERRRRVPGGRALSSAVVALALLVGGAGHRDGSQARAEAHSGSPGAAGVPGEPPRILGRRRSVKSGGRLRKAA